MILHTFLEFMSNNTHTYRELIPNNTTLFHTSNNTEFSEGYWQTIQQTFPDFI